MATETVGERFVQALLEQDWEEIGGQLADSVRYRGITTSGAAQYDGKGPAITGLQNIFEDGDVVTEVETLAGETLQPVERLSYRFQTLVPTSGEKRRAEQHVFITSDEDAQITKVDLLCSGWLPVAISEADATSTR